MELVTETLITQLAQQINAYHVVVWYDPEGAYGAVAAALTPAAIGAQAIHRYQPQHGYIRLRRDLEPLWQQSTPPRLLIYVPQAQPPNPMQRPLVEYEVAGVVMQPGGQPPECNTALAAVARAALTAVLPQATVEDLVAQAAQGQLTLADLDKLAAGGQELHNGAVAVIFDSGNASDIALRFLMEPALDAAMTAKQVLPAVVELFAQAFGFQPGAVSPPQAVRTALARHLLLGDLRVALADSAPPALQTVPLPDNQAARHAIVELVQRWRNQRDLAAGYAQWAHHVETEIGLANISLPAAALARVTTFAAAERQLQQALEQGLATHPDARQLDVAQNRLSGFWATHDPHIKTRWDVIAAAAQVLLEAERVRRALQGKPENAEQLIAHYAFGESGAAPWRLLDTAQRHLERDFARFELDPNSHATLAKAVTRARQAYAATTATLAERFSAAYAAANFELPALLHQTDIFREHVAPHLPRRRVAYLLVDALRFEMACELVAVMDAHLQSELTVALATPPTITEVGMAALMPAAEKGLALSAGKHGLSIVVDGKPMQTRQQRLDHLRSSVGQGTPTVKLDEIAPLSSKKVQDALAQAAFVVVTATDEIDSLCENMPNQAHRLLDDALNQLRRGVNTLLKLGFGTIVIAADHGYLFGEQLTPGDLIDAPGGDTVLLKRRAWLGKGGANAPGTLRRPLSSFGLNSDLELVTPHSLAVFKVPGGSPRYFHGGLSLQELLVPVLTLTAKARPGSLAEPQISWQLQLGSPAITTRFISVTVNGQLAMFTDPPAIRVELRAGSQTLSTPVSAKYGFNDTSKDVQLLVAEDNAHLIAENTVTLLITEEINSGAATLHLLDATTGISLQQLKEIPIDIAL